MANIRLDEKTKNFISELAEGLAQEERYAKEHDETLSARSVRECRNVVESALVRYFTDDMSGREGWAYSEALQIFFRSEYLRCYEKSA